MMLIGLLTLYTAEHFRRSYDGAGFVRQCIEMVCRARYGLQGICVERGRA